MSLTSRTTYTVEEIHSGGDEDSLWVSIGFVSAEDPLDVLHIVCGKVVTAEDRRTGMADLYLERTDQGDSGYGGVRSLIVQPDAIELELDESGQENLRLPDCVRFVFSCEPADVAAAAGTFHQMSLYEHVRGIAVRGFPVESA